jgi:hypothetical protein
MELTNELLLELITAEANDLGRPVPTGLNLKTIRAKINRSARLRPLDDNFDYLQGFEQDDERFYAQSLAIASVIRSIFTTN